MAGSLRLTAFAAALLLPGMSALAQDNAQPPDTIEARVQGCAPCHGDHGQGTKNDYFPRLAGKPSGYLFNQLVAFRNGRRHYPPMNYLLEFLPDGFLHAVADYFAAQYHQRSDRHLILLLCMHREPERAA